MKKIFYVLALVLFSSIASAQNVAINTDGTVSDPSAMLDVKSTNKGVLIPRMTTTQRTGISSPATGLLVFDTNTNSFWFYNGSAWTNLTTTGGGGSSSWDINGSSINNNNTGNVGIGTNTPAYKLDVAGRMRVKTGTLGTQNTSSGIWMEDYRDGADRIFFGMQDSIRAGLFGAGAGGAGWKFNFNAKNGFVGLGKNASTYRLEIDDNNGSDLGLYKNGNLGGSFKVTDSTMEVNTKNGSTLCVPNCPASDLILIPPVAANSSNIPGNVGIGINDPLHKLSLNGAMGFYNGSNLIGSLNRTGSNFLINAKTGTLLDGPANLILQTPTGAGQVAGNVGIGVSNPVAKLEVDGNIKVTDNIMKQETGVASMLPYAYGSIRADGTIAGSTGNFSVVKGQYTGEFLITLTGDPDLTANKNLYTILVSLNAESFGTVRSIIINNKILVNTSSYGSDGDGGANYNYPAWRDFNILIYRLW